MNVALAEPNVAGAAVRESPYQGLRPFREEDAEWFFGRDDWIDIVIDNIHASRASVLYGESGVGKSSLVAAGVLPRLRAVATANLKVGRAAELAAVTFDKWSVDDPTSDLIEEIGRSLELLSPELGEKLPTASLGELAAVASDRLGGPLVIVLDQFEEIFQYHRGETFDRFEKQLTELVWRRDAQVSVLIAIREDSLAKLDRLHRRIPRLLDNLVRIRHLDTAAAHKAIEKPVEHWNDLHGSGYVLETSLVDEVIERASDRAEATAAEPEVEATVLQLVMQHVWEATAADGDRELTLARLERLGGAEQIVESHVRQALSTLSRRERSVAAEVFRFLVTRAGTKNAQSADELADQTDLQPAEIVGVLEQLSARGRYVLRPVASSEEDAAATRYELFHDVLAEPIVEWRRSYDRERARRRAFRVGLVVAVGVAILVAALVWAVLKRRDAEHASKAATRASKAATLLALTATANDRAATPLDSALLLSLAAYRTRPSFVSRRSVMLSLEDALEQPIQLVLRTHTRVAALGVDQVGDIVATADRTGRVRLWNLRSRRPVGHALLVADAGSHTTTSQPSVAFSPNGKTLAEGTDARLTLWDGPHAVSLRDQVEHIKGEVRTVAFSPNDKGKTLAAAGFDGHVRLWDVRTHRLLRRLDDRPEKRRLPVNSLAFSPNGRTIASGGDDGLVRLWAVRTGRPLGRALRIGSGVVGVAFDRNGLLAAAGRSGTIAFWNVRDRKRSAPRIVTAGAILDLAVSATGDRVAAASDDGTVRVWDTRTGDVLLASAPSGSATGRTVDFDARGRLVSSSTDGAITVWSKLPAPGFGAPLPGRVSAPSVLAVSPDGTFVVAGVDKGLQAWNAKTRKRVAVPAARASREASALEFTPDGTLLADAVGGNVRVWRASDLPRLLPAAQARLGRATVDALAFRRDGLLAAGDTDGRVRVWNVRAPGAKPRVVGKGSDTRNPPGKRFVYDVAFSADGTTLASGGWDGTLRIWNVQRGGRTTPVGVPDAMKARSAIRSLAFNPKRRVVAAGSADGTISLWDVAARKKIAETTPGSQSVESVAFSPNGEVLATAGDDGTLRFWDVDTLLPLGRPLTAHAGAIRSLASSRDASLLASAGDDGTVRLWSGILWPDTAALTNRICGLIAGGITAAEWDSILRRVSTVAAREPRPNICGG